MDGFDRQFEETQKIVRDQQRMMWAFVKIGCPTVVVMVFAALFVVYKIWGGVT